MKIQELINKCEMRLLETGLIYFDESDFESLTPEMALEAAEKLAATGFMKLPDKEIRFFERLKTECPEIWSDLWGEVADEPYVVGAGFLPVIAEKRRGFPICDLLKNDNFFFVSDHITPDEGATLLDTARTLFRMKKPLTLPQTLILEISIDPIDVWRFAYLYGLSAEKAKNVAQSLIDENALIHLVSAEHLAPFVTKYFTYERL